MKIRNIFTIIVICLSLISDVFSAQGSWRRETGYIREKITRLFVHPEDAQNLFIGTENTIYVLDLAGQKLTPSLIAGGSKLKVYAFEFIPGPLAHILAATDKGLYSSQDKGRSWQKQNLGLDLQSQQCFSLLYDPQYRKLYIGTAHGLYIRKTEKGDFEKEDSVASNTPVYKIQSDSDFFYIVTPQEVIRFGRLDPGFGETIYRVFDKEEEGEEYLENLPSINDFVVSPQKDSLFMAVPAHGILKSDDHGREWQELPSLGVPVKDVNQVTFCPGIYSGAHPGVSSPGLSPVCAATETGVYVFQNKAWVRFDQGITTQAITALAAGFQGTIYAAADTGIYSMPGLPLLVKEGASLNQEGVDNHACLREEKLSDESPVLRDVKSAYDDYARYVEQEPAIQDVHRMVIEYADVSPDKIRNWKGKARMKSLLPSLSVGLDRMGTNLFHWNTAADPDELQKGREYLGWDVSLSWDFSDLIWSSDQTSIDSRAKLMVELREDLLSHVTRIYFERRRIQMEIFKENISPVEGDASFERHLRVAELTAIIDAMTGGMFSKRISQYAR
jgi:photosystem II stability/assembly factor-like uncharacterized protein